VPGAALKFGLIGLGTLVVPLDTAVNIAFPAITSAFGLALADIQWVIIAYVLTYGSLMLGIGRVGDVFGHALVFRAGLAWSVGGFLLCAAAPGFGWLLACRVVQGIGAALVISCGAALVTGLYPESQRPRVLGAYAFCFAAGSVIGPALGGALVERFGWPVVFWGRVPIALAALLLLRGLPAQPRRGTARDVDAPGAALLAVTIGALLLAVNQARHLAAGGLLALPLAGLALGAGAGFVWWARRTARPVITLHHARDARVLFALAATIAANAAAFAVLLLVPYWLTRVAGLPGGLAGLVLAAGPLGAMLASPLAGWGAGRLPATAIAAAGLALVALGLGLVAGWAPAVPPLAMAACLLVSGAGLGLVQVSGTDMITGAMPREDRGVAGSLAMLARTLGIVTAASLLALLFAAWEAGALRAGATPEAAFLAAFAGALWGAAALPAGFLAVLLVALRRRGR
jgi:MFS family permease